jgi:hypothetical protein
VNGYYANWQTKAASLRIVPCPENLGSTLSLYSSLLTSATHLQICNSEGKIIYQELLNTYLSNLERNTSQLNIHTAGTYFILLRNNKETMVQKVIINK